GHGIGDRLLRLVAECLRPCLRSSDTLSRQGGDEFVILLPEIEQPNDAGLSAEKMLIALAPPQNVDQHNLQVTASIGISVYPRDGTDPETLIKNADMAMY